MVEGKARALIWHNADWNCYKTQGCLAFCVFSLAFWSKQLKLLELAKRGVMPSKATPFCPTISWCLSKTPKRLLDIYIGVGRCSLRSPHLPIAIEKKPEPWSGGDAIPIERE